MVKAIRISAPATTTKPPWAMVRGGNFSYKNATKVLARKMDRVYGMIAKDVSMPLRP
jgi:hypothetical protein